MYCVFNYFSDLSHGHKIMNSDLRMHLILINIITFEEKVQKNDFTLHSLDSPDTTLCITICKHIHVFPVVTVNNVKPCFS
jgi:hypothetical protein